MSIVQIAFNWPNKKPHFVFTSGQRRLRQSEVFPFFLLLCRPYQRCFDPRYLPPPPWEGRIRWAPRQTDQTPVVLPKTHVVQVCPEIYDGRQIFFISNKPVSLSRCKICLPEFGKSSKERWDRLKNHNRTVVTFHEHLKSDFYHVALSLLYTSWCFKSWTTFPS